MDAERLKKLLEDVQSGHISVENAIEALKVMPYEDIGFAKLDTHRHLRTGFPEVVFCQNKTPEQAADIVKAIVKRSGKVLATRVSPETAKAIKSKVKNAVYHETARIISVEKTKRAKPKHGDKYILVVCAGTADIPIAEEAAVTAEILGSRVERAYDIGVAGLHRLLDQKEKLLAANVLVVVAGMEGALASVVGGMVSKPVIAVPTSVGYGASFGGLAALLAMLNSCAAGVAVTNIDNGFGAGYFAHLVNK